MSRFLLALALALWAAPILAHETTRSYVTLTREGAAIRADIRLAFRDIEVVVWMDEDLDGAVTWGEVQARLPGISTYLTSVLDLSAGGACRLNQTEAGVSDSGGLAYLDLGFQGNCPSDLAGLEVTSRLFADVDPDHRMYLTLTSGGATQSAILGAESPTFRAKTGGIAGANTGANTGATTGATTGASAQTPGFFDVFLTYLKAGALHLAGGFDHVVFLLMLMLPAVTRLADRRRALGQVVTAITGFTLAHALTLTAASTTLLQPPTDLITLLVAGSIILTALDNIRPFLPGPRAGVAAFFGLIHGFGFATVLGGSAMTGGVFVTALFGFNLGIELAQIGVVVLTAFALFALQGGRILLTLGSLAGGAAGIYWMLVATSLL